ncbi:MAG: hypothetical protein WBY94_27020 [Polyangiaceae bacterium]
MSSSWSIWLGFLVIVAAAFWYDATVAPGAVLLQATPGKASSPR